MIHLDRPEPVSETAEIDKSSPQPDKPRRMLLGVGIVVVAVIGVWLFTARGRKASQADSTGKAAGPAAGARPVPVLVATARTGDVGVYLTGLGTVTPLSTVTVRSRVDGQLVRVAFAEGQLVHQGDLLAEIDPRPFQVQLEQAQGQKAKDEAALANAKLDLERYRVITADGILPEMQLDAQKAAVNQLEGAIRSDQAQVDGARLNLTYSRITAPISGRVGLRLVDPGNMVHAADANGLVVIAQLQPISVLFTVPADQISQVLEPFRAGKKLAVDAFDRDLKKNLATGTLLAVDNQVDQTTGTVRLKALFANEKDELFPNQFVNARLLVDTLHNAVIIPAAAVQRSPQSTYVYTVQPDKTVAMRPIEVQLTEGADASIRKGLSAGDVVVVDGADKLQPGSKVSVVTPDGKGARQAAP